MCRFPAWAYETIGAAAPVMANAIVQIRLGLMVGIGAGLPDPNEACDFRLGNVAVRQPV